MLKLQHSFSHVFSLFQILPLFIVDATNYFGRIVSKQKDPYAALADEVNAFYKKAKNLVPADPLEKLAVYGLREENTFHRYNVSLLLQTNFGII